ncbi:hypothetical protein TNCV_96211 [Trichonephila clavipes]|nr:hypothetical protein TNCV_96211 [Trichonephila clavipes]
METFEHPPYSPDHVPTDYHLFPKLKLLVSLFPNREGIDQFRIEDQDKEISRLLRMPNADLAQDKGSCL